MIESKKALINAWAGRDISHLQEIANMTGIDPKTRDTLVTIIEHIRTVNYTINIEHD